MSSAAAQGKLAYVSPTVRQVPPASASKPSHHHGAASGSSRLRPGNNLRNVGASGGLGQLSPVSHSVQIGQPVLLNAPSQVEVRG